MGWIHTSQDKLTPNFVNISNYLVVKNTNVTWARVDLAEAGIFNQSSPIKMFYPFGPKIITFSIAEEQRQAKIK